VGNKKDEGAGMLVYTCWLLDSGLGFNDIEEVACVNEDAEILFENRIYCLERIVIDLLLLEVHPGLGIEAVERGLTKDKGVGINWSNSSWWKN